MIVEYEDIEFDVYDHSWADITGESQYYIPTDLFLKYLYDKDFDPPYIDDITETTFIENSKVSLHNVDGFIAFINWYSEDYSDDENYVIEVHVEHIHWLFHDVQHALCDVTGNEIYINGGIEKERIFDGLDECITREIDLPSYSDLEKIEEEYYERWNTRIDLEEYKYHGYEEE